MPVGDLQRKVWNKVEELLDYGMPFELLPGFIRNLHWNSATTECLSKVVLYVVSLTPRTSTQRRQLNFGGHDFMSALGATP